MWNTFCLASNMVYLGYNNTVYSIETVYSFNSLNYPITIKIQATNKWLGNMYHALSITINSTMEIYKWKSLWTGMADNPPLLHHITKVAKLMNSVPPTHCLQLSLTLKRQAHSHDLAQALTDHNSAITVHFLATNCFSSPVLPFQKWVSILKSTSLKPQFSPRCLHFFWYSDIKSAQGSSVVSCPSPPLHYYLTLT